MNALTLAVNILFSLSIFGFALWRLGWHADSHNCLERVSMGFMAAGMLLSIPSEFAISTPFDYWSNNLARGAFLAFLYAIFGTRRWMPVYQGKGCMQLIREARL